MEKPMIEGYKNYAHKKIADWFFGLLKEGQDARKLNKDYEKQYSGHDVRHVIRGYGWVFEDLRQGLIKHDHIYAKNQERFENSK